MLFLWQLCVVILLSKNLLVNPVKLGCFLRNSSKDKNFLDLLGSSVCLFIQLTSVNAASLHFCLDEFIVLPTSLLYPISSALTTILNSLFSWKYLQGSPSFLCSEVWWPSSLHCRFCRAVMRKRQHRWG